jgi:hypothetical protein
MPEAADHLNLIFAWLTRELRKRAAMNLLGGLATLLAGLGVLVVTWAAVYMVSIFILGPWIGYHHWIYSIAGLVFIPALFWGNSRTSREYLSEYSVSVGTVSQTVVNFYLPGVGVVSNINPLAPETVHTGLKMITDCLYCGPRVVVAAFKMFAKSGRLRRFDSVGCASVLTVLLAVGRKMSFQEVVDSIEGLNPVTVFPQLQELGGVLFLQADPPGLKLSQELAETLRSLTF